MKREIQNGLEDLSHETLVAISKLVDKAKLTAARQSIDPGTHIVDLLLVGQLQLEVKEDYSRKGTSRIPYTVVIALLLKHAGYTKKSSVRTLTKLFREAHAMDKDAAKHLMQECGLTETLTTVQKIVADSLPPIQCKGATKVSSVGLVAQERRLTRPEAEVLFPGDSPQGEQDEVADES